MNTVYTIHFKNNIEEDMLESSIEDNTEELSWNEDINYIQEGITRKSDKILDNKVYLNPEDAILALESVLNIISEDEQMLIENGMYEYSVSSYELV